MRPAAGKSVVFCGAMKPERQGLDAAFNLGGAVAAAGVLPPGSVAVCMGGRVPDCDDAWRNTETGLFCGPADGEPSP